MPRRLVKSISTDSDEERITWTGGNPTEVWWGTVDSYDLIDKASYGTVPNKTNLDLNWFVVLETEGWAFASGIVITSSRSSALRANGRNTWPKQFIPWGFQEAVRLISTSAVTRPMRRPADQNHAEIPKVERRAL
mgnify:CR=1 FL=1